MGVVFLDATVTGSAGKQESVRFLVDGGVMYTLLPRRVWHAIGLRATDSAELVLEDGTQVKRELSECQIVLAQGSRHTPVMLGTETDEAVLGRVTLSEFGLMLNPFTRRLERMRLMLGRETTTCQLIEEGRRFHGGRRRDDKKTQMQIILTQGERREFRLYAAQREMDLSDVFREMWNERKKRDQLVFP